jgi:hypothetical protein
LQKGRVEAIAGKIQATEGGLKNELAGFWRKRCYEPLRIAHARRNTQMGFPPQMWLSRSFGAAGFGHAWNHYLFSNRSEQ